MSRAYKIVDLVILFLCLPFYAVAIPLLCVHDWLRQKRGVRLGQEVSHFPMRDVREDYLVADVSRLDDGLVGIRRRRWNLLGRRGSKRGPPSYRDEIEYIRRERFWIPRPFSRRDRRDGSSDGAAGREDQSHTEDSR